ncbi:MAG: hypothetical protein QF368_16610, partial [SAR202 cluster bacterium]|nr:hypothetical protein [SAR202 cluster bacterium]
SGATVGVKGVSESESDGAIGVWGQAGKANGAGIGVLGQAFSKNIHSVGVKGTATGDGSAIKGSAAAGRGLWGNADSGIAVMGEANTGEGGYFHSNSSDGVLGTSFSSKTGVAAVVGRMEKSLVVEGSEGDTFGVWGDVTLRSHAGSIGVKGTASAGIGVRGESNSNIGVRGQSTSNFGGFFETDSNSQFISGVMGKGKFGGSKGVTGQTSGTNAAAAGVYGQAVGTSGATAGVLGENGSLSDGATGVSGLTTSSTGKTYGVMGETNSGTTDAVGVYGKATKGSTMGVYGENTSGANLAGGVVGVSNTETSNLTIGVWGRTNNPNGFGIYSTGNALVNGELTTNSLKSDDGTLEVGGNVHVGGKLTFGAKKGYLAVPHIAFVPEKHNQEYTNNEVGLRNIGLGSLARKYFNAPVHLPQGAKITRVSFGYYGSGALEGEPATCAGGSEYGDGVCSDGRFWLYRGDILGGSSDVQIAHLRNRTTTVSEVNTTLSASAAISGTAANVDNSKFGYFIQVGLVADNIRFKGAIIEYEYTEP